jgi:hypothetical protein
VGLPEGDWTILRIGHTSAGKDNDGYGRNAPGSGATKMDASTVKAFYDGGLKKIAEAHRGKSPARLALCADGFWEARCQNWTPLPQQFRSRGYDPR